MKPPKKHLSVFWSSFKFRKKDEKLEGNQLFYLYFSFCLCWLWDQFYRLPLSYKISTAMEKMTEKHQGYIFYLLKNVAIKMSYFFSNSKLNSCLLSPLEIHMLILNIKATNHHLAADFFYVGWFPFCHMNRSSKI